MGGAAADSERMDVRTVRIIFGHVQVGACACAGKRSGAGAGVKVSGSAKGAGNENVAVGVPCNGPDPCAELAHVHETALGIVLSQKVSPFAKRGIRGENSDSCAGGEI